MNMKDFECQRCGKCCLEFGSGLSVSAEEIERWRKDGRWDLFQYVDIFECKVCPQCNRTAPLKKRYCDACHKRLKRVILGGDLWFDPETGEELNKCPFLRKIRNRDKYKCLIHDAKPERCRDFPRWIATECLKCHLNFVKYFKDRMFPEILLEEYFKWSLDDFYERVLKNVERCPKCGEPIPKFQPWALENCPAVKEIQRKLTNG